MVLKGGQDKPTYSIASSSTYQHYSRLRKPTSSYFRTSTRGPQSRSRIPPTYLALVSRSSFLVPDQTVFTSALASRQLATATQNARPGDRNGSNCVTGATHPPIPRALYATGPGQTVPSSCSDTAEQPTFAFTYVTRTAQPEPLSGHRNAKTRKRSCAQI